MNRRNLAIAALAIAGALGTSWAQARGRDDVQWSVTIGTPTPAVWVAQPVQAWGPVVRGRSYEPAYGHGDDHRQRPTRWDRDGDGIPNRYDRVYNPRWDRDGDGIPNRYDRVYNPRWDRDGDGIPNRYDPRDNSRPGRR